MASEYQRALDFIERAEASESLAELQQRLTLTLSEFGIPHYTLGAMLRENEDAARQFTTLVRGVTPAWSEHYWEEKYFNVDAAVHLALRRVSPFSWQEVETSRLPESSGRLFAEIRDAMKIVGGYVVPVHDEEGFSGVVALHHEDQELPHLASRALKLISIYALERAKELYALDHESEPAWPACPLSGRQREILAFAAAGKSEGDTGDIMQLASTTVREHLAKIRSLLGVRTKTQAVAIAVRQGWVIP
jgi:DNA-binding CsgD family transcriptional regulator